MYLIPIPCFKYKVYVVWEEKDYKHIDKYTGIKDRVDNDDDSWAGRVIRDGSRSYIVLRYRTLPVVVHEIVHVVKDIVDTRGIKDEETEAYLVEYILEEILKNGKIIAP